jgi:hypothetical protein
MNIRIRHRIIVACAAGALLEASLACAHHSFAYFDQAKDVTYDGYLVEYRWENPHTHLIVKVPATAKDPATVGTWDIEGGSVNIMTRQGWKKSLFKPGDHVQIVAHPMKDGSKGASLYYAILPDGTKLYHDIARPKDEAQ